MKRFTLAVLLLALAATGSMKAITADDLARHLGITSWQSTVDAPAGAPVTICLWEIVDGKTRAIGGATTINADSVGHIAVMAGPVDGKPMATVTFSGASFSVALPPGITFPASSGLGDKIAAKGEYVLGGEYKTVGGKTMISGNVADVTHGLLLQLQ